MPPFLAPTAPRRSHPQAWRWTIGLATVTAALVGGQGRRSTVAPANATIPIEAELMALATFAPLPIASCLLRIASADR